jgi:peptidoglycan/LPS O-acetylase OafA/YrhL
MGISQSVGPAPAGAWRHRLRSFFVGRPLDACIASGRDNVLQLRILAAVMVIFGHSYAVLGSVIGASQPLHYVFPGIVTHVTGVNFFFTISGLLITLSWLRRPELGRFLRARFLRIWPALAVCVTLTAFVIGPLVTSMPLHKYFIDGDASGTPLGFAFYRSILVARPFLPGVFEHNPVPRYVNGSLWTLPIEATMYLCVAALGVLRCFRFPWLTSAGIVGVFAYLVVLPAYFGAPTPWLGYVQAGFFGAGCIACLLRRYVPVSSGLMLLILVAAIVSRKTMHLMPFTWLAIGYFVLWFCYVPRMPRIPRDIDLSYGTYLWAFPLQQVLVMSGVGNPLSVFAITTPIVLGIAALSWFLIEKPALRLKDWRWPRLTPRSPPAVGQAQSVEAA